MWGRGTPRAGGDDVGNPFRATGHTATLARPSSDPEVIGHPFVMIGGTSPEAGGALREPYTTGLHTRAWQPEG